MQYAILSIIRPEILERTLSSFQQNVKNNNMFASKCYVNIDNNPNDTRTDQQVKVLQKYFAKENLIINISNQSNFPEAVKWLYTNIDDNIEYTCFIEDDWIFTKEIDMLEMFKHNEQIHSVIFRCYNNSNKFYQAHTLHKTSFLKYLAQKMTFTKNPQVEARQLSNPKGFYQYPEQPILKDIGRKYLRDNKLQRNSRDPAKFINLIKQKDIIERLKNE